MSYGTGGLTSDAPIGLKGCVRRDLALSGWRYGVGLKSLFARHRPLPLIQAFLLAAFALCPASGKCFGAESNAPPFVTSQIEATNFQELLHAYLQLQEQFQATQLTIEQNRQEAKEAAARNAEALSKGLQSVQQAFSAERAQELEVMQSSNQAMQRSNKVVLDVVATFAAMVFLTLLILIYFQRRTSGSLAAIAAALPAALGFGPGSAVSALGPDDSHLVPSGAVEQSNLRLFGAIEQLKKRIQGLGQGARFKLKSSAGTSSSGGNGGSPAPSNGDSGARNTALMSEARSLLDADNTEAAIACFDKVLALEPDHREALVKKGAALERLHKLNEAIECYDRAIAVDSTMTIAYLHKGGLCNRLERFKEALECYEKALRTHDEWSG